MISCEWHNHAEKRPWSILFASLSDATVCLETVCSSLKSLTCPASNEPAIKNRGKGTYHAASRVRSRPAENPVPCCWLPVVGFVLRVTVVDVGWCWKNGCLEGHFRCLPCPHSGSPFDLYRCHRCRCERSYTKQNKVYLTFLTFLCFVTALPSHRD